MYLYTYGLIVGRFQMLHNGHKQMITTALELCDKVVVYVGSSQEAGTLKNPFSYNIREKMINDVFDTAVAQKRLLIRPLPDIGVGNNDIWGRYVLGTFEAEFHRLPDLYVTGCEKNRSSWFNNEIAPTVDELRITRKHIDISSSKCREALRKNNRSEWEEMVPQSLYDNYNLFYNIVKDIKELEPKWVYRFEHTDPTKGAWYNKNGVYCCSHPVLKQLDMPYEPDIYKGIYRSACENGKDLTYWIPKEAAIDMINNGYQAAKYLTNDYFLRDHGEICFNKTNYLKKEVVNLDEIYNNEGEKTNE